MRSGPSNDWSQEIKVEGGSEMNFGVLALSPGMYLDLGQIHALGLSFLTWEVGVIMHTSRCD